LEIVSRDTVHLFGGGAVAQEEGAEIVLRRLTGRCLATGGRGRNRRGLVVTLKALRFPIDRVSLTTALELEAYLTGAKKRRERETRAHPEG
jgi:hypothetical protein